MRPATVNDLAPARVTIRRGNYSRRKDKGGVYDLQVRTPAIFNAFTAAVKESCHAIGERTGVRAIVGTRKSRRSICRAVRKLAAMINPDAAYPVLVLPLDNDRLVYLIPAWIAGTVSREIEGSTLYGYDGNQMVGHYLDIEDRAPGTNLRATFTGFAVDLSRVVNPTSRQVGLFRDDTDIAARAERGNVHLADLHVHIDVSTWFPGEELTTLTITDINTGLNVRDPYTLRRVYEYMFDIVDDVALNAHLEALGEQPSVWRGTPYVRQRA